MSRRRKKNTLLPKMIVLAVVVNAVALPLLARFGAFKAIHGERLTPVRLVSLPPPPKRPPVKKPPVKKQAARVKPRPALRAAAHPATARVSRPNPNQPKVVAAAPGASGAGATINNNGTGAPGQLPDAAPPSATPPASAPTPPAPVPAPAPPPAKSVPAPPAPEPIVTAAEPLAQPPPQLPDDLSADDIHGDFVALFTVQSDGTATVKPLSSTGNARLDALALDAARRWTFRPATVDGKPTDSFRRLRIQFYAR